MQPLDSLAHTGVAIPRIEGKCTEKHQGKCESPAIFGGNRYLVSFNRGIATTSVRTGLAMTGYLEQSAKQQFLSPPDLCRGLTFLGFVLKYG